MHILSIIWDIAVVLSVIGFVCFIFVIAFGAPFLPTLKPEIKNALDLIDLKEGQHLLELGSGDGRILVAAAKKGIYAIGYEINPLLVIYSWLITRRYSKYVSIRMKNYWNIRLPECDGIFVFLLQPYMEKLDKKVSSEISTSVKLVSFAFTIPNKKISKTQGGMYLYKYPSNKVLRKTV